VSGGTKKLPSESDEALVVNSTGAHNNLRLIWLLTISDRPLRAAGRLWAMRGVYLVHEAA